MSIYSLDWRGKRKLIYIAILVMAIISFGFYLLYPVIYKSPTCSDGIMNGSERGADCGGACDLVCKQDYVPLATTLEKSFNSGEGSSDILIVLENKNKNLAPKDLKLSIDTYDSNNKYIETIEKNVLAGTQKLIPILIKDYKKSNLSKVFVKNLEYNMYHSYGAYDVALVDFKLDGDKLNLKVRNIYKEDMKDDITLYIILRDELGNSVAVNSKTIKGLEFDEVRSVDFLWKDKIAHKIKNIDVMTVSNLYYVK